MEIKIGTPGIKDTVLALGPESEGNFSLFWGNRILLSENFGNLLDDKNFRSYQASVQKILREYQLKPKYLLSDLHPLYRTTAFAQILQKKYKATLCPIQHHVAHVFSAMGENAFIRRDCPVLPCYGIACDGTGWGFDEKVWGGEVFLIGQDYNPKRIGKLENHLLLGGDKAVKEPARLLFSLYPKLNSSHQKKLKTILLRHYSLNEFTSLVKQMHLRFNCPETSSTGRVIDAVSLLLGISTNERLAKHGPSLALSEQATTPYDLTPEISRDSEDLAVLATTPLFEYLLDNLTQDKKRLAATAFHYLASGLLSITRDSHIFNIYAGGGIAGLKPMADYFREYNVIMNTDLPKGDASLSFGQIAYFLFTHHS